MTRATSPIEFDLAAAPGDAASDGDDGTLAELDTMAVETSLSTHLHGQLNVLPLSPRDLVLARAIVESLDDDGYLRTPLEELIGVVALDPPATLEEMQIALRRVQSLEPAGVGARSVGECLHAAAAGHRLPADARRWPERSSSSTCSRWRRATSAAWRGSSASRPSGWRRSATASAGSTRGRAGVSARRRSPTSCPT